MGYTMRPCRERRDWWKADCSNSRSQPQMKWQILEVVEGVQYWTRGFGAESWRGVGWW